MLHAEINSAKCYRQHFFLGKKKFLKNFHTCFNMFIANANVMHAVCKHCRDKLINS